MQSTYIPQMPSELISLVLATAKRRKTQLIAKWQKIDGKLVCRWVSTS